MSTTQPIICCLGESVAGRPTQFVLERAFEAQRMHWQAISVELRADRFSQVCEAALAMGFRGMRFYGEFEREAASVLAAPGSLLRFIGRATSALNIGDSWQVWDSLGPAWISLLEQLQPTQSTNLVCLQGDNRNTRSLFAALVAEPPLKNWLWLDAPVELASLEHPKVQAAISEGRVVFTANMPPAESLRELWHYNSNEAAPKDANQPVRIALVSSAEQVPEFVAQCAEFWAAKFVVHNSQRVPNAIEELVSHHLSEADLAVAGEAYDFTRWTNSAADLGLLRDAYDEYCDY